MPDGDAHSAPAHILVVDDETLCRRALARVLTRLGYTVSTAADASEALDLLHQERVDVVLTDLKMPGLSGIDLIRRIREGDSELPCIIMTAYGNTDSSVSALRAGAFWYLHKPFDKDYEAVQRLIAQAVEHSRLRSTNRALRSQLRSMYGFENIVGRSDALRKVLDMVERVADSNASVLITGESGTGKELIARALHFNSPRADRNFVAVNCGAIPEELLESELFGHVRGAFTNAVGHREGRFALANNGTIFLDEIGDMSTNLQVKLLRVLGENTFEPVGSSQPVRVNVRTIAATNQDLNEAIADGRFRSDLYFRLNVIPIEVPPLRERRDDIPLLAEHFLELALANTRKQIEGIRPAAMARLCAHDWPGNVRELENLIERLVTLKDGGWIDADDLPPPFSDPPQTQAPGRGLPVLPESGFSLRNAVGDFQDSLIRQALERTNWNKTQAANMLKLNRTTLTEMIRARNIHPEES